MSKDQANQRQARREQTLEAIERLPLNPEPVVAVMACPCGDPDALVKVLKHSSVLAGRVIGVANSAGSSAIHRMDCIERCVRHLGAKQARTVALTMAMQLMMQDVDLDEELLHRLWVSSANKAIAAQLIAQQVSPELADSAFNTGLLQDIALPVFLAIDPAFFSSQLAQAEGKRPWVDLEREHFGIDHAELAMRLLQQWNAPPALITQIARHHNPLEEDDMAWLAEMPSRFAGLLRHVDEEPTRTQQQTLAATHTRFLSEAYPTLEATFKEITKRVKAMGKVAGGSVKFDADLIQQVTQAVTSDTFALAAQINRLDRQLSDNMDALAECQKDVFTDSMTRLLNRRGFETIGAQMLAQARKAGQPAACFVIDLDNFKEVNDSHGHAAGDTVLKAAADLIRSNVSAGDLVARMGGDEFLLLIIGDPQGDTHAVAQRLHAICNGRKIKLDADNAATLSMSIGGVFLDTVDNNETLDNVLHAADQVMYQTKRSGKSGVRFQAVSKAA